MSFRRIQGMLSAMVPFHYSQALGGFSKNHFASTTLSRVTAGYCFPVCCLFCAVLQDGWATSWAHVILASVVAVVCLFLFLIRHQFCFFSFWHNRKSTWQVCFTAALKMLCLLEANPLDTISKCCYKITIPRQALRKKQSTQAGKQVVARHSKECRDLCGTVEQEWLRAWDKWQDGHEYHQQPMLPRQRTG